MQISKFFIVRLESQMRLVISSLYSISNLKKLDGIYDENKAVHLP